MLATDHYAGEGFDDARLDTFIPGARRRLMPGRRPPTSDLALRVRAVPRSPRPAAAGLPRPTPPSHPALCPAALLHDAVDRTRSRRCRSRKQPFAAPPKVAFGFPSMGQVVKTDLPDTLFSRPRRPAC